MHPCCVDTLDFLYANQRAMTVTKVSMCQEDNGRKYTTDHIQTIRNWLSEDLSDVRTDLSLHAHIFGVKADVNNRVVVFTINVRDVIVAKIGLSFK